MTNNQIINPTVQGVGAAKALDELWKNYQVTRNVYWLNNFKGLSEENSTHEALTQYKQNHSNFSYEWHGIGDYLRTLRGKGLEKERSYDFSLIINGIKIPLEIKNWRESRIEKYGPIKAKREIFDRFRIRRSVKPKTHRISLRKLDNLHLPAGIVYITNKRLLNSQARAEFAERRLWIVETIKELMDAITRITRTLTATHYRFSGSITSYLHHYSAINRIPRYYKDKGGPRQLISGILGSVSYCNIKNKIIEIIKMLRQAANPLKLSSPPTHNQPMPAASINTASNVSSPTSASTPTINWMADNSGYKLRIQEEFEKVLTSCEYPVDPSWRKEN